MIVKSSGSVSPVGRQNLGKKVWGCMKDFVRNKSTIFWLNIELIFRCFNQNKKWEKRTKSGKGDKVCPQWSEKTLFLSNWTGFFHWPFNVTNIYHFKIFIIYFLKRLFLSNSHSLFSKEKGEGVCVCLCFKVCHFHIFPFSNPYLFLSFNISFLSLSLHPVSASEGFCVLVFKIEEESLFPLSGE